MARLAAAARFEVSARDPRHGRVAVRLLTWNCNRGDIGECVQRLRPLKADLIVLQECTKPADRGESGLWRGPLDNEGVAVVSNDPALKVERLAGHADLPETVLPVIVHAPEPFILIDLWARREPTYEAFALQAVSMCAVGIALPMVVVGDFNSTPIIESQRRTSRELLRRLRDEFGLVSAYHTHLSVEHGREPHPTFFMNQQENRPFHLDYCFVPEDWAGRIRSAEIGTFGEWQDSNHRPLVIELTAVAPR